jgi:hypothetical protein
MGSIIKRSDQIICLILCLDQPVFAQTILDLLGNHCSVSINRVTIFNYAYRATIRQNVPKTLLAVWWSALDGRVQ